MKKNDLIVIVEYQKGLDATKKALEIAPNTEHLMKNLLIYQEAVGDLELA